MSGAVALVHATLESDRHIACMDCNGVTKGGPIWSYPKKCGGCDSFNIVELPIPPALRTFTLRICPLCGIIVVDEDELRSKEREFILCSGPWVAGWPTDRSHKPTLTQCVKAREEVPVSPLATVGNVKCYVHPERQAVVLLQDTSEPLCAACYGEHLKSNYPAGVPEHAS